MEQVALESVTSRAADAHDPGARADAHAAKEIAPRTGKCGSPRRTSATRRAFASSNRGLVVAELEGIGPSARGRLAAVVDEAIDEALALRGAPAPGITAGSGHDATLSDQLFRARRAGCAGLAVILGPLRAATGTRAALNPADCATLRFLAEATRERPLVLVLDAHDATTGAYGDPVPLQSLLTPTLAIRARVAPPAPAPAPALVPSPRPRSCARPRPRSCLRPSRRPLPPPRPPRPSHRRRRRRRQGRRLARLDPQLTAARGPQPLAVLEKLFTESYMPLANAIAAGLDDPRARHAHDEFSSTFSRGYTDAFATFASTTTSPRMVLDAMTSPHASAVSTARAVTRVLLVDAMRWDVARTGRGATSSRGSERTRRSPTSCSCGARCPRPRLRQLETIARGVEALALPRCSIPTASADPSHRAVAPPSTCGECASGLASSTSSTSCRPALRRRHLPMSDLPGAADAAADAIARHAETCHSADALLVTGDHGFRSTATGRASGRDVARGGARGRLRAAPRRRALSSRAPSVAGSAKISWKRRVITPA